MLLITEEINAGYHNWFEEEKERRRDIVVCELAYLAEEMRARERGKKVIK